MSVYFGTLLWLPQNASRTFSPCLLTHPGQVTEGGVHRGSRLRLGGARLQDALPHLCMSRRFWKVGASFNVQEFCCHILGPKVTPKDGLPGTKKEARPESLWEGANISGFSVGGKGTPDCVSLREDGLILAYQVQACRPHWFKSPDRSLLRREGIGFWLSV